jgi:hypothetical protein
MRDVFGVKVFRGVREAIAAGYEVLGVHPDADGYLRARTKIDASHYAIALIDMR